MDISLNEISEMDITSIKISGFSSDIPNTPIVSSKASISSLNSKISVDSNVSKASITSNISKASKASKASVVSKSSIDSIDSEVSKASVAIETTNLTVASVTPKASSTSLASKASKTLVASKISLASKASIDSISSVASEDSVASKASIGSKISVVSKSSIATKFSTSSKTLAKSLKKSQSIKSAISTKTSKISKSLKKTVSSISLKTSKSCSDESKRPKSLVHKIGKVIKSIITVILAFLVLYALFNILCYSYERNELKWYEYGMKLDVNDHNLVVDIAGEQNEPVIILLPEYSTPSPIIQYKPLVEALSNKYKVITMEPFGYGLSDAVDDERVIDNIVTELHTGIKSLGIEEYYLMGNSIGGMYSLYWANQYSKEVLGFIGLDAFVPGAEEMVKNLPRKINKMSFLNHFGIERSLSILNSKKLFHPLTTSYNFNEDDIKMFRIITLQKGYNKTQRKEINTLMENLNIVKAMKFPEDTPVINFVCSDNMKRYPQWKKLHIEVGYESSSNKVIEVSGDQANFVYDQRETISKNIESWIKQEINQEE